MSNRGNPGSREPQRLSFKSLSAFRSAGRHTLEAKRPQKDPEESGESKGVLGVVLKRFGEAPLRPGLRPGQPQGRGAESGQGALQPDHEAAAEDGLGEVGGDDLQEVPLSGHLRHS